MSAIIELDIDTEEDLKKIPHIREIDTILRNQLKADRISVSDYGLV